MSERPRVDQPHYGAHLGDPGYWGPYVGEVLRRHSLPSALVEPPFVGSFPTFLVGDVVVKLFGDAFDGPASHAAELAMHELLADHPEIPAPYVVASGCLFGDEPRWPYLVSERLPGRAIRDVELVQPDAAGLASRLGAAAAMLHELPAPSVVVDRELVPKLRSTAADRLRTFGLPEHLVEQVGDYLIDAEPPNVLVHADMTGDHIFIDDGRLVGIIDWGDAIVADRYYELVAVYLDAFRGRRTLLDRFLDGYGWPRYEGFSTRCLQGILEFQFNAITAIREFIDLDRIDTLDALADRLFG